PEKDKKKKFTLQISSFQDKSEADALVAKLAAAGYKPYVILSEVEGKGTFFRVRIGEYRSKSDASDAKEAFERQQRIIAYVTKMCPPPPPASVRDHATAARRDAAHAAVPGRQGALSRRDRVLSAGRLLRDVLRGCPRRGAGARPHAHDPRQGE